MLLLYLLLRAALLSNIQYLHSTMLLLYPKLGCIDCVFAVPIYIPLCFYFIQHDLRVLEYNASDLHSTMLLLYPILKCPFYSPIFNLHSTMLLLYRFQPGERVLLHAPFTFHYASTLSATGIQSRTWQNHIYIPLCFYFIWFIYSRRINDLPIYIPLCFYFIGFPLLHIQSWLLYLHSTMLLLSPESQK